MSIIVDIADRMYDYTDEEVAAEAVEAFQYDYNLSDNEVFEIWESNKGSLFLELRDRITDAVDANGSFKRAQETVPCGVSLVVS
ncbi:MAG: hypothetical protein FD163_1732 [Hyphomonadaceae bacterium]|nr:MAG: hypothetical protein FD128_399 [Hyphomonadaceae bacterium]KAF0185035.1 MAG: hypothetical protein FD163_1732 [Hyphomonadaceae bacterium]